MAQDFNQDIFERVREKKESYRRYNFERLQEEAFATFFDLAQEYTSLDALYQICVAVPKEFFALESRLYVINAKTSKLEKVCTSQDGVIPPEGRLSLAIALSEKPYETEDAWIFPIRGNKALAQWIPFFRQSHVLGAFEIYPKHKLDDKDHFFFGKLTNRIGFNLHQKMLIQQKIDHIKFINQLVSDIEHNVITPNMYYKLFLIKLKKQLQSYCKIQQEVKDLILSVEDRSDRLSDQLCEIYFELCENNHSLDEEWRALSKHYEHTSLFLETLFRRDHFEKGAYVLRRQSVNFRTEIIQPLLERYLPLFEKREITVDNLLESVPDEQVTLFVDKGLISQVFDNLFSNSLKYAQQVEDQLGNKIKLVSYNRDMVKNHFGKNIDGVRFNFFTTGKPLSEEECRRIFDEGYRAAATRHESGTGHGLHFLRNVVEIHGGFVGCESQRYGNLFYFILPVKDERKTSEESA